MMDASRAAARQSNQIMLPFCCPDPHKTSLHHPGPPAPAVIFDDNFINSQNMDEEIFSSRLQMAELLLVAGGVFVVSTDVEKWYQISNEAIKTPMRAEDEAVVHQQAD